MAMRAFAKHRSHALTVLLIAGLVSLLLWSLTACLSPFIQSETSSETSEVSASGARVSSLCSKERAGVNAHAVVSKQAAKSKAEVRGGAEDLADAGDEGQEDGVDMRAIEEALRRAAARHDAQQAVLGQRPNPSLFGHAIAGKDQLPQAQGRALSSRIGAAQSQPNRQPLNYVPNQNQNRVEAGGKQVAKRDYGENPRVVWVGGQGRSGTTLVRAMLDAHPALNCGPETILLPDIIGQFKDIFNRMEEKNESTAVGLSALRSFVLRILSERAEGAPMLCSKEPYNLRYGLLLDRMFPNSKFVFVVRDGRAVCRDPIPTTGRWKVASPAREWAAQHRFTNFLSDWNHGVQLAWESCVKLGIWKRPLPPASIPTAANSNSSNATTESQAVVQRPNSNTSATLSSVSGSIVSNEETERQRHRKDTNTQEGRCLPIFYEMLVQDPERWMRYVFEFLELPFLPDVLHHQEFVGTDGPAGIRLSNAEPRTKQVSQAVYRSVVSSWASELLALLPSALSLAQRNAPMLGVLGYRLGTEDAADSYRALERRYSDIMDVWASSNASISIARDRVFKLLQISQHTK